MCIRDRCERLSVLTENKVANMKHRYELSAGKLIPTYGKIVEAKKNKTEQLYQSLLLLDISKIKARGFSLVTDEDVYKRQSINKVICFFIDCSAFTSNH